MKIHFEDLSPEHFERLVVSICKFVLGAGTQGFAVGPDGGRDAKFVGMADLYPSKSDPWKGTVIVQAKHTNGLNCSFSDPEFYGTNRKTSVLASELPRIRALRESNQLDHYMLFSNRKLTANTESELRRLIATSCGLAESSIALCGIQSMEPWLKQFPDAVRIAEIDPVDGPLIVRPDELAEVVEHLAIHLKAEAHSPAPPTKRVGYERKNELNAMSAEYARDLRRRYMKDEGQIRTFLAAPENERLRVVYEAAVEEFQLNIIAKRKDHQSFDDLLNYLYKLLVGRDSDLARHPRLTRAVLFYMYWNCDIGRNEDAET